VTTPDPVEAEELAGARNDVRALLGSYVGDDPGDVDEILGKLAELLPRFTPAGGRRLAEENGYQWPSDAVERDAYVVLEAVAKALGGEL
jgi:hypothetical protein